MSMNAEHIGTKNKERMREELDRKLTSCNPVQGMEQLRRTGAMNEIIPQLVQTYSMTQNHYHFGTVWEHTMKVLDNMKDNRLELRMAALLHDVGKITTRKVAQDGKIHFLHHETASAKLVEVILNRLSYPTEFIRKVQFLVCHHMDCKAWKDNLSAMKNKHLRKLHHICRTEENFQDLMLLIDADNRAHAEGYCMEQQVKMIIQRTEMMKENGSALFNFSHLFTREDIKELKGLEKESEVKECHDYLMKLAYVNPLRSKEEWAKHLMGYHLK